MACAISRMRSLPAGWRSSQKVSPIPYAIATNAQTRAKRTAWSLKKFRGSASYKLSAETPRRRGFVSQAGSAKRRGTEVLLGLRRDLRHDREEQLAQAFVVRLEDLDHLLVRDR